MYHCMSLCVCQCVNMAHTGLCIIIATVETLVSLLPSLIVVAEMVNAKEGASL